MGTRGLTVWRFRKRYFPFYSKYDSYPQSLGKHLVNSIPTDLMKYQRWLQEKRQMVNDYDDRYDRFLSVPADINEQNRKQTSGRDEDLGAAEDSEPSATVSKLSWQCPDFVDLCHPPSFVAPLNDLFIEWVYTINLDQEVFSINNKVHYHLAMVGEIGDSFETVYNANGDYHVHLGPPKYRASLALDEIIVKDYAAKPVFTSRKLVQPLNIGNIPWNKRHGAIFRTLLFSIYRHSRQNEIENGLAATLLQWHTDDFAFRELAYSLLCLAPSDKDKMHQHTGKGDDADKTRCHTKQDSHPEYISELLSGAHLEGLMPGASPNTTVYWFGGALVILTTRLQDPLALERGLHQIAHHKQRLNGRTFNAILLSIEHIVLVKMFTNGRIQHTAAMPLFKITTHSSIGVTEDPPPTTEANICSSPERATRNLEEHASSLSRHPHSDDDPDATFHALIAFFDALAYDSLAPAGIGEGCLPGEIYKLIIQHVLDPPTRHACMEVSRTFRDICLQDLLIGENIMLLPSEPCKSCIYPHITPEWFTIRDLKAGVESLVVIVDDEHYRKPGEQDYMHVLVGSEYNRKSLLPFLVGFLRLEIDDQLKRRLGYA
ncbi:MAG: hypothetical protein Q9213_001429 [Squamulea squamosa]